MPTAVFATVGAPTVSASSNFLIPNGTFIAELIGFLLIAYFLAKKVVPRLNTVLTQRQDEIRRAFTDSADAQARLEAAEAEVREQLSLARADAARQRQEAHEQGAQILADLKAQAQIEADRITAAAHQQIEAERTRTVAALRSEIGTLAIELASRVVGESLADDARQRRVVERFLAQVESDEAGSDQAKSSSASAPAAGEQVRG